jgi:hypothetical protein
MRKITTLLFVLLKRINLKKILITLTLFVCSFGLSQSESKEELKKFMASMYEESNYLEYEDMTTIEIPFVMNPNSEIQYIPCLVNGVYDYFVFDTGCSAGLAINKTFFSKLLNKGEVLIEDYIGDISMLTAVGNYQIVNVFVIKEVVVGDPSSAIRLKNVKTMVYSSDTGPLLLGQDLIKRFSSLTIDNKNQNFVFKK